METQAYQLRSTSAIPNLNSKAVHEEEIILLSSDQNHHQQEEPSTSRNVSVCDSKHSEQGSNRNQNSTEANLTSKFKPFVLPSEDHNLIQDCRSTASKFLASERCQIFNYFPSNPNIAPYMRNVIVKWMSDVCYEEITNAEVFPLSVNYMDRFLGRHTIYKTELQGLAAACLLIASKIKMYFPLLTNNLSAYTDHSVPVGQILSWELIVLSRLDWDVSSVTAVDFVEPFIQHFNQSSQRPKQIVLHEFQTFTVQSIHFLQLDFHFAVLPQATQAAVAVHYVATLNNFGAAVAQELSNFFRIPMHVIHYWTEVLKTFIADSRQKHQQPPSCQRRN